MITFILVLSILAISGVVKASVLKTKYPEPTVLEAQSKRVSKGVDLSRIYDASTISKSRRSELSYDVQDSVTNFSTTTVINRFGRRTVSNLQWIGNPPYHVSQYSTETERPQLLPWCNNNIVYSYSVWSFCILHWATLMATWLKAAYFGKASSLDCIRFWNELACWNQHWGICIQQVKPIWVHPT